MYLVEYTYFAMIALEGGGQVVKYFLFGVAKQVLRTEPISSADGTHSKRCFHETLRLESSHQLRLLCI